jgi:predicted nucleotidyltransferase
MKFKVLYKKHLNKKIFYQKDNSDKYFVKDRLREKLLKLSDLAIDKCKIKDMNFIVKDITLTGSIVNYNYKKTSDIDLHIVVSLENVLNKKIAKQYLKVCKDVLKNEYNIKFEGYEVEIYFQDEKELHAASAVYSLKKNRFIKKPKYIIKELNQESLNKKLKNIVEKLKTVNCENVNEIFTDIVKSRREALSKNKNEDIDYIEENIIFKLLRDKKILQRLKNKIKNCDLKKINTV